jgi:hypothetical protein
MIVKYSAYEASSIRNYILRDIIFFKILTDSRKTSLL